MELVSDADKGFKSMPTLSDCSVDLTQATIGGELDDVFGRDDESKGGRSSIDDNNNI